MAREAVAHFAGTKLSIEPTTVLMDLVEVLPPGRTCRRSDRHPSSHPRSLRAREDVVSAAHARELIEDLTNAGA